MEWPNPSVRSRMVGTDEDHVAGAIPGRCGRGGCGRAGRWQEHERRGVCGIGKRTVARRRQPAGAEGPAGRGESRGVRGERSIPRQPQCRKLGRLTPATQPVTGASRPRRVAAVPPGRLCSPAGIVVGRFRILAAVLFDVLSRLAVAAEVGILAPRRIRVRGGGDRVERLASGRSRGPASSNNCRSGARAEPVSGPIARLWRGERSERFDAGEHARMMCWPTMPSVTEAPRSSRRHVVRCGRRRHSDRV